MNKLIETYLKIIEEAKFKNKKWKFDKVYENVEIYENYKHLENRLKERYSLEIREWMYWNIVKNQIVNYFIENKSWDVCKDKVKHQKMYSCHLTESDVWCGIIIQNDVDELKK